MQSNRYLVVKAADVKAALSNSDQLALFALLSKVGIHRLNSAGHPLKCLVIEKEDPAYNQVLSIVDEGSDVNSQDSSAENSPVIEYSAYSEILIASNTLLTIQDSLRVNNSYHKLVTSISEGRSAVVIDIGYSYSHICNMLEGEFNELPQSGSQLKLNPFSILSSANDIFVEFGLGFISKIISNICSKQINLTATHINIIEIAVRNVWKRYGGNGNLQCFTFELYELNAEKSLIVKICAALKPYTDGEYSEFFKGDFNPTIDRQLTVFELEKLVNSSNSGSAFVDSVVFSILLYVAKKISNPDIQLVCLIGDGLSRSVVVNHIGAMLVEDLIAFTETSNQVISGAPADTLVGENQ